MPIVWPKEGRVIMSVESRIAQDVTERQVAMFAMFVGPGLVVTRAALSRASGIPESTLKSYADGAAMPLHAALAVRRFLPPEAMNMVLEPAGIRFCDVLAKEANWDSVAADAAGLTFEICEARKDGSIDHVERARLRTRGRAVMAALADALADD